MALLGKIGKTLEAAGENELVRKYGKKLGVAGLFVGAAALGVHSQRPGATLKAAALDTAFGDPTADVDMLGFPLKMADFFPAFQAFEPFYNQKRLIDAAKYTNDHPESGGLPQLIQTMGYEDRLNNWYMNTAEANVKRGYSNIDTTSSIFDYKQRYTRQGSYANQRSNNGVSADGSMVFGMYNMRMR